MPSWVTVKVFHTRLEAELAKGLLEQGGMIANILGDDVSGLYPQISLSTGFQLQVTERDEEEAARLLASVENKDEKTIDVASIVTLVLTVIFFVIALFEKGFTHDMLLEAGVFLVSLKLVLAAHKSELQTKQLMKKLELIEQKMEE